MAINVKSVFISGLVSGLIIITSGLTMVPVVGNEMDRVLASRGLPPLSNLAMSFFGFVSIITGLLLVWLYALLKDRFGSGIKTALVISFLVWFMTYFLSNLSLVMYGFMPVKLTVIGTFWGLGELLIAGIVGLKLYKEAKK
jgi:hypothetical protein